MATRRSSSNRSSKSSSSPKKQPKGYIWINTANILTKTTPHELGHGATKTVYLSEYSSDEFVFDINEIQGEGDEFNANKYAIARIQPRNKKQFTDDEMNSIYDELELQMDFARTGKATKILGLLLKFPDNTIAIAYTEEEILHELTLTPNPRVCYILMERCGFVTSNYSRSYGQTKSIWKINRDPRVVVQQVIDCINHIVDEKKMVFYDFKELNVCVSPENQIIALDFDRHFCKYLREVDWRYYNIQPATQVDVAKGYMFLLFSCEYYKHIHNPKQEIVDALYEGIQQLNIDTYLEQICRFSEMGRKNLLHYLIHRDDKNKAIPSLVQYIEVNYLEQMKPKPKPKHKRGRGTKGGQGTKGKGTKKRY